VEFKTLDLTVTSDGHTIVDNQGGLAVQVALYWKNNTVGLDQFRKYVIDVLIKT